MMKRFWIYLWLAMLIAQVLTFWLSRRARAGNHPVGDGMDAELVSLAAMTNDRWQQLLPPGPGSGPGLDAGAGDELLRREELLLGIRERERLLAGWGVEVGIVDDLKAWLAVGGEENRGSPSGHSRNRFLADLVDWLDPFVREERDCPLKRLSLHPDTHSPFPAIAFELAGDPPELGRRLLSLDRAGQAWSLREMDLLRFPENDGWWLRGSFVFREEGRR